MLLSLLLALGAARVIRVGPGYEFPPTGLRAAVDAAAANDIIELTGECVVQPGADGVALPLSRPVIIRAALEAGAVRPIVRLATADGADVIFGVGASGVRLENLIIGRPAAGSPAAVARIVAVLASAGTQSEPSTYSALAYGRGAQRVKRSPALAEIHVAREARKRQVPAAADTNRSIGRLAVVNVDFSASASHTNIGFGAGAYASLLVTQCRFADDADANAIVTAVGSVFDSTSAVVRNVFGGSLLVQNGVGLLVGANYWAPALRAQQTTYCLDAGCTSFGPVVDADVPTSAYESVAAAVRANVQNIQLTVYDVEWARDEATRCTTITRAGTTISGVDITTCQSPDGSALGISTIRLTSGARPCGAGALMAVEGALTLMSNVQLTLNSSAAGAAIAIVPASARLSVTGGSASSTVLLQNVKLYGSDSPVGISLQTPATRVVLSACDMFGFATGILHLAGQLSVADSALIGATRSAIEIAGSAAKHGLRVSNTVFFGQGSGITFTGGSTPSALTEFYVACSRFLFMGLDLPGCSSNTLLCASALRHNSFIVAPNTFTADARTLLARGANHYEESPLSGADQYYKFVSGAASPQVQFALSDHQGRIDDASGTVTVGGTSTRWEFVLATSMPMRAECFASTSTPSVGGTAVRVVSNFFDVRTDAPEACVSIALRVALAAADIALATNEQLAIYGVEHVGSTSAAWTLATSHYVSIDLDGASVAVDASSGGGSLMRAVVVAGPALASATVPTATQAHAALAATRMSKQLCVACGTDRIPAHTIDERCGGGTASPVFTSIDAALSSLSDSSRSASVSLLVYGSQCVTSTCSVQIGATSPNKIVVEGLGPTERGALRRPAACASPTPFLVVGSGVTLRYLLVAADAKVAAAIPSCAISAPAASRATDAPQLAYLTIGGGVCVESGRTNVAMLNCDVSVATGRAVSLASGVRLASLESNSFAGGSVWSSGNSIGLTSNSFGAAAYVYVAAGDATMTGNTFAARRADTLTVQTCTVALAGSKLVASGNSFGDGCTLQLNGSAHSLGTGSWTNTRATADSGMLFYNVTLSTGNSIKAGGPSAGVVLSNVVVSDSLADALVGFPMRSTRCAQFEAKVGGFNLARSSVLVGGDASIWTHIAFAWPTTSDSFIDPSSGDSLTCEAGDEDYSDYCRCALDASIVDSVAGAKRLVETTTTSAQLPTATKAPSKLDKMRVRKSKAAEKTAAPTDKPAASVDALGAKKAARLAAAVTTSSTTAPVSTAGGVCSAVASCPAGSSGQTASACSTLNIDGIALYTADDGLARCFKGRCRALFGNTVVAECEDATCARNGDACSGCSVCGCTYSTSMTTTGGASGVVSSAVVREIIVGATPCSNTTTVSHTTHTKNTRTHTPRPTGTTSAPTCSANSRCPAAGPGQTAGNCSLLDIDDIAFVTADDGLARCLGGLCRAMSGNKVVAECEDSTCTRDGDGCSGCSICGCMYSLTGAGEGAVAAAACSGSRVGGNGGGNGNGGTGSGNGHNGNHGGGHFPWWGWLLIALGVLLVLIICCVVIVCFCAAGAATARANAETGLLTPPPTPGSAALPPPFVAPTVATTGAARRGAAPAAPTGQEPKYNHSLTATTANTLHRRTVAQ